MTSVTDSDIYRTASVIIGKRGEEAWLYCSQRADAMLEAGDIDGCAVWKRILTAVKEIQNKVPTGPLN